MGGDLRPATCQRHAPDPRACRMAIAGFGLRREDMVFVAFAGWHVAGAKWCGYPTFRINRPNLPGEALGVTPDAVGGNLDDHGRSGSPPSRRRGVGRW